jgi:hypothetical protein
MDITLVMFIDSLKNATPRIDITVMPTPDHIAYAILTSIFLRASENILKHRKYAINIPTDGISLVNPLDIFISEVPINSSAIAKNKKSQYIG